MRIACLTFHNSSNYGSALQAYALQETVLSLGHGYTIIDYSTPEKSKFDSLLGRNKEMSSLGYAVKIFSLPYNLYKKNKFSKFRKNHLNISNKKSLTIDDLEKLNDEFDYFICGSDQIWNAHMVRFDPAYFLSFVKNPNRKIAYAASFGISNPPENELSFYKKHLDSFNKISVRERTGAQIVFDATGKQSSVVLDPSLLLDKEKWAQIAENSRRVKHPYILTYCFSPKKNLQSFVHKLSKETGLPVIRISTQMLDMILKKAYAIPSPIDFIRLFLDASYIVTNSFHGTAFSTNLNKNFFSVVEGNKSTRTNSRIFDFLDLVQLKERIIYKDQEGPLPLNPLDFKNTNNILDEERRKSIEFLRSSIG